MPGLPTDGVALVTVYEPEPGVGFIVAERDANTGAETEIDSVFMSS